MTRLACTLLALGLVLGCGVGCGAGSDPAGTTTTGGGSDEGGGNGGDGDGDGDGDGGSSSKSSNSSVGVSVGSSSSGAGGAQVAEVYGHSANTLYRLDLDSNDVGIVGPFTGCDDQVIDIALDKNSVMYGTTLNSPNPDMPGVPTGGLWRIDKETGACELISRGDYPNSLSFVPEGTLDSQQEALVGYSSTGSYVRINTQTGAITTVRANALGGGLESSGDIVSVIDGPTYLTVKGGACDDFDCVVQLDPVTGAIDGNLGSTGYNSVFGVAFWAGKLYGFTSGGEIFEFFENESGQIETNPIPASVDQFYGAGSTTAAPPIPVPN